MDADAHMSTSWIIIDPGSGLLPIQHQPIIQTKLIGPLESQILINTLYFLS